MSQEPADRESPPFEHAVSIDVEDYRQILSWRFRNSPGPVSGGFERDMDEVLAVLAGANTLATFFVTGTVAEQRPDLLRRWQEAGHEIASHGYSHAPIWSMGPEVFQCELQRAKGLIEDAIGRPVPGYRAPVFSVRWDTLWALDVIAECGFTYDSSVVPVRMRRYGIAGFDPQPTNYRLPSGLQIVEMPISTARVGFKRVPIAGGGYFRLFSFRRIRRAVAQAQSSGVPFVMYCHPDELGPERFSAAGLAAGLRGRVLAGLISLKSNIGRWKVRPAVQRLLSEFRFGTLGRLADKVKANAGAQVLGATR